MGSDMRLPLAGLDQGDLKSPLSVTEIATIVEVSILSKADIRELIHAPEPLTINQDVNELTIF